MRVGQDSNSGQTLNYGLLKPILGRNVILQQSNTKISSAPKRATLAFALSLAGGILVLLEGIVRIIRGEALAILGTDRIWHKLLGLAIRLDGVIGVVLAIIIIIGAVLVYNPKTQMAGSTIVLILAILSIISGGGWLIGLILGVVGGILGLVSK